MSNRLNRYRALYEAAQKADNASVIPRHVFVRSANSNGNYLNRKGDR